MESNRLEKESEVKIRERKRRKDERAFIYVSSDDKGQGTFTEREAQPQSL